MEPLPEVWLRGPLAGIAPALHPVGHALLQSWEEISALLNDFPDSLLWERPAGVASVAFHLQHIRGVLDRLFTYARNESLSERQFHYLREEGRENPTLTVPLLLDALHLQVRQSLEQLQNTPEATIPSFRAVGRKQLPSTVLGLLFHAAEHTQRHTGQLLVTARILNHSPGTGLSV